MEINKRLRDYIEKHGIKQIFVSQKTGISVDRLSKILAGSRKLLASDFLLICESIEVDPNTFRSQETA